MNAQDLNIKSFLDELYQQTGGDMAAQASMYDVGAAIGLEKAEAGSLAEELMVQGLVELKTLAGGIGITAEGLATLGVAASSPQSTDPLQGFGEGPVTDDKDRQLIDLLTTEVKNELAERKVDFELLEEIILDLKSIEVQLLSPKPKIAVFRELFRSLHGALSAAKIDNTASKLAAVIA